MNISGGSKSGVIRVHRKRINEDLDYHLERLSSPSSKGRNAKERGTTTGPSAAYSEPLIIAEESRSTAKSTDEEYETDSNESIISISDKDDASWISWFCNIRGNGFFCEVDDDFIQDDFNLCGLPNVVPYYEHALDMILDAETSDGTIFTCEQNHSIESAAEMLYGLIHARYILSSRGLAAMLEKYKNCDFGRCPRTLCCGQQCLPVGKSDVPRLNTVNIYCPRCKDIYTPGSKCDEAVDGAYFGTTFPHLFLMTYPNLIPLKALDTYVPRVFGYRVHKP